MGTLTRAEMEAVIKAGGSVLYRGAIYHQLGQLPDEAELAEGDEAQEAVVASALDAQIAALTQQRERLQLSRQAPAIGPGRQNVPSVHPFVTVVGEDQADRLRAAGFASPDDLAAASDEDLLAVEGVGQATLKKIRAAYGKR